MSIYDLYRRKLASATTDNLTSTSSVLVVPGGDVADSAVCPTQLQVLMNYIDYGMFIAETACKNPPPLQPPRSALLLGDSLSTFF